jgi:hypothetical protein
MASFDITEINVAVERLLGITENPWHRYLLSAYGRHRLLEMAGRYKEIFAPDMTVEDPVYRLSLLGRPPVKLDGREEVEAVYRRWTATDQHIFYIQHEQLAVGDTMITSRSIIYQQARGSALVRIGVDADENAMYLTKSNIAMIWPYDERGRMVGEDVWEYDDTDRDFIKLDPADVVTADEAAKALEPLIKPLPPMPNPA